MCIIPSCIKMADSISSGQAVEKHPIAEVEYDGSNGYHGRGTVDDPFIVEWRPNEADNPM